MKKTAVTADYIKKAAGTYGADLCGLASADRFEKAPPGFHPQNVYKDTKTVIVVAKRFPASSLYSASPVPYTITADTVLKQVLELTVRLTLLLEESGVTAVPIPSEPYEYWDEKNREGRGIISLRHAGHLAGLGVLGKNTLLYNKRYGNMITLGAVLVDIHLPPDDMASYSFCNESCVLCIQNCPGRALNGITMNQKICRSHSQTITKKGYLLYCCHICREICPHKKRIKT